MAYQSAFKSDGKYRSAFGKKPGRPEESGKIAVSNIEDLKSLASGLGLEVKEKKPSVFSRTMDLMSRPLYATVGASRGILSRMDQDKSNDLNILGEAWRGLTGQEKKTFSDVLEEQGVENKFIKGVVGFALDVALDPTTYVGGSLVKYGTKGLGLAAKTTLGGVRKLNPLVAEGLEVAGKGLKDAIGNAFVYGYGTSKAAGGGLGVADQVANYYNKLGIGVEDITTKMNETFKSLPKQEHQEFAKTLLEFRKKIIKDGGDDVFDRTKAVPEFKTKAQEDFFNTKYKPIIDDMAEQAGIPIEKRFASYFPSINIEKIKQKNVSGAKVAITDESYKKLFKGVNENELDKPIEALSRTSAKIFRDNLARETLNDLVRSFGLTKKQFEKLPDAEKSLYSMVREKQFGKEIGYMKKADFDFINNAMYPESRAIDMLAKASGYDSFSNVFKTAVTAYFPAFHVRNAMSGLVQNYSVLGPRVFDPSNISGGLSVVKGSEKMMSFPKWVGTGKQLQKILQENFGGTSRYISDLGNYIEDLNNGTYRVMSKLNPRRLGNLIEINQKAHAIVTALKSGKTIDEAVKLAEMAGFNYSKLTNFEAKVLRRIIPFYSFARKNAELQLRTLAKSPERVLNQKKFAEMMGNIFGEKTTEDDLKGLPDWAVQGLGFKISGDKYLTQFGLPIEEFLNRANNPLMSTLTSLNPIIKYNLESKMGYDFFREKKLVDINDVAPGTGQLLYKLSEENKLPDFLRDAINIQKYKDKYTGKDRYIASPKSLHIMRNLPTSRLENTLNKIFGGDTDSVNKWVAFFSGGKIYDIDVEKQRYFTERDLRQRLENELMDMGVGERFEQFYIPKERTETIRRMME